MTVGAGRRATARLTALAIGGGALLAGCGSGALSDAHLRTRADAVCANGRRVTDRIAAPSSPRGAERFLAAGVASLSPAVIALGRLHPSADAKGDYERALEAAERELALIRGARATLRGGGDAVVTVRALQQRLAPVESAATSAWRATGAGACATLFG